eukprot:3344182-Rhodomonas_salina.1
MLRKALAGTCHRALKDLRHKKCVQGASMHVVGGGGVEGARLRPFILEQMPEWYACSTTLSNSDCEPLTVQQLLNMACDDDKTAWESLSLGYPSHNTGSPALLRAVADLYPGTKLDSMRDVTACVPQEGIFVSVNAILEANPGHVVVQTPCYQSLVEVAKTQASSLSLWAPRDNCGAGSLIFDVDDLEALIKPTTTLIILNLPHNPTGTSLERQDFLRVVALAAKQGSYLFVDEMYRGLEHGSWDTDTWPGPAALPAAVEAYERGVSLGGMSKVFSAPGLRLGWIATRCKTTTQRLREIKDYTSICAATPSEQLACIALKHRSSILEQNRRVIRHGLAATAQFVSEHSEDFEWCAPSGGTTIFPRLIGRASATAYTKHLAADRTGADGTASEAGGLMLVPSSAFEFGDERVRFGVGRADVPRGLE